MSKSSPSATPEGLKGLHDSAILREGARFVRRCTPTHHAVQAEDLPVMPTAAHALDRRCGRNPIQETSVSQRLWALALTLLLPDPFYQRAR